MDLKYEKQSFDLVLDKSTIDALLCGDHAYINTAKMLKECQKVLKVGGIYMAVSYGEPPNRLEHFKREYLSFDLKQFSITNPYKEEQENTHYIYVCTKLEDAEELCEKNWPQVQAQLEEDEKLERAGMPDNSEEDDDLEPIEEPKNPEQVAA